jgi:tetratricopeptide (TPR) repeat protein
MSGSYRRAHLLAQAGRYEEAERTVRAGLAEEPGDGRLLTLLASVLRMRRDYPAALAAADSAAAASPLLADAHAERAENLILLIRSKDAVAAAEEAVRLDQLGAAAFLTLARALAAASQHERARAAAAHGLALDPRSVEGLLTVAEVEREAGNREAAATAARAALAIEPENTYGRWMIAMLDAERLRVRRSMRALRDVARASPARPDLISMTWPIRGVITGLRRGLFAGGLVICALLIAGHWWWPVAGSFARVVSAVLAAILAGFGARVLLPAGRLPWRCVPLLPSLMRRSTYGSLTVLTVAVVLLILHAAAGWWIAAVLAFALAPVLWALGLVEMLGAGLDDPGISHALRSLAVEFREWWVTTKRDLRAAWKDDPKGS